MKLHLTNPNSKLFQMLQKTTQIQLPDGRIAYQMTHIEHRREDEETIQHLYYRIVDMLLDLADETGLTVVGSVIRNELPQGMIKVAFGLFDMDQAKSAKNTIMDPAMLILWMSPVTPEDLPVIDAVIPAPAFNYHPDRTYTEADVVEVHPVSGRKLLFRLGETIRHKE